MMIHSLNEDSCYLDIPVQGLFAYASDSSDVGRQWRPDLVPAILRWCELLARPELADRVYGFGIDCRGGFLVNLSKDQTPNWLEPELRILSTVSGADCCDCIEDESCELCTGGWDE